MTEAENGWRLTDEDRWLLADLRQAVRSMLRLTLTGQDVIAVGEVIDAMEGLGNGREIEVNVGLEAGFRHGDVDFEEGLFVCLRINDEAIVLDELHTTYSKDVGSDHFTVTHATLCPRGHFDEDGVANWIAQLKEVSVWDNATIQVSRDHV